MIPTQITVFLFFTALDSNPERRAVQYLLDNQGSIFQDGARIDRAGTCDILRHSLNSRGSSEERRHQARMHYSLFIVDANSRQKFRLTTIFVIFYILIIYINSL
jgi:hypothetical protein